MRVSAEPERPKEFLGLPWLLLAAALPFAYLLYKVAHFGYYFPYWDAWEFVPFLEHAYAGQLSLGDLGVQHNEHRPFFPRLLMLVLARLTHWNVGAELTASIACATLTFGILFALALRTRPAASARPWWMLPLLSWFVFSWVQMENWVWGWQVAVFMSVLAVAAGVALLAPNPYDPRRVAGAAALGVVASWSFANGLVYWFALVPMFWGREKGGRQRGVYTVGWLVCALVVIQLYLYGYQKPDVSPSFSAVLENPGAFVSYILTMLGAPAIGIFTRLTWHGGYTPEVSPVSALPGFVALCVFALWSVRALQAERTPYYRLAPWFALALYVGGSAVITAAGRVGFGLDHALTSRYTTITNLFWIALAGLFVAHPPLQVGTTGQRRLAAFLTVPLTATLLLCVGISQQPWEQLSTWKAITWQTLRAGYDVPFFLADMSPSPTVLKEQDIPFLRAQGLCGMDVSQEAVRSEIDPRVYIEQARAFAANGQFPAARAYLLAAHHFTDERDTEIRKEIGGVMNNLGKGP